MSEKPPVLLVYAEGLNRQLVTDAHRARLAGLCRVLEPEPVPNFDDPRALPHLDTVEILLTGWGCPPLDEAALDRVPNLRGAFHAAGTVKNHVKPACFDRGVRITSAAYANAIPVAEFTVAAIVMANKKGFRAQRLYREVKGFRLWSKEYPEIGNHGKTVGIVGASRIGRMVIDRLQAFDVDLLVYDPYLDAAEARGLGAEPCELDDLLGRSDVVSLHAPSLPATRHMIDRRRLGLMNDGAVLVNTARGALVDHEALTDELVSGRIEAVIDTTEPELLPADSPLYDLDNVFLTPHIAGSQGTETRRMLDLALDEIERFVRGEPLQHEVRREDWDRVA
ncbi:MAG: hydroxyacid dehydrogenase [Deltaproteobacteria bacterium]|nr:hydroxyacid dehydrogenase [Deltaproteobacteria bacterium]MBW2445477.1 hydroxyacid dehydrogenase [Deltaproteobacteria bacterium]